MRFSDEVHMMKAYSYIRFSSAAQAKGDSLRRQTEAAKRYCEQNNLILDQTLTFHDLGISAFKGSNVVDGRLGAFIQAVDQGLVEAGSTLLVESLDRLSRDNVPNALNQFTNILSKGITIVTLADNKVYTRESINDLTNIMISLIIMSRANEESVTKSKRIKAAWDNKQRLAETEKKPKSKHCPVWIELVDGKYQIIEKNAQIIRDIVEMYLQGYGYHTIRKELTQKYDTIEYGGRKAKCWYSGYIQHIVRNEHLTGRHKGIEDYYPRLISDSDFAKLQLIKNSKLKTGGMRGEQQNMFVHLLKCGLCGGTITKQRRNNIVYYTCNQGRQGITKCSNSGWPISDFEFLMLKHINELDVETIIGKEDVSVIKALEQQLNEHQYNISVLGNQKNNLIDAIANTGGMPALIQRLNQVNEKEEQLLKQISILESELKIEKEKLNVAKSSQQAIKDLQNYLDNNEVRVKINMELKKLISKIEVFVKIRKFNIVYKAQKVKVGFSSGSVYTFPDVDTRDLDYDDI